MGALKLAKKAKILGAGNSKRTIANAMHELRSVNRTLAIDLSNSNKHYHLEVFIYQDIKVSTQA